MDQPIQPMAPATQPPVTQPAAWQFPGVKQLFKAAWKNYSKSWWRATTIALIVVAYLLVNELVLYLPGFVKNEAIGGALIIVVYLAGIFVGGVVTALTANAMIRLALNTAPLKPILSASWKQIWSTWLILILMWIFSVGGFLALIFPMIALAIWFGFSLLILITENRKGFPALVRSYQLARPLMWTLFFRWLAFSLLMLLILVAVLGPLVLIGYFVRQSVVGLIVVGVAGAAALVVYYFFSFAFSTYYLVELYHEAVKAGQARFREKVDRWKKILTFVVGLLVTLVLTVTLFYLVVLAIFSPFILRGYDGGKYDFKAPASGLESLYPGSDQGDFPATYPGTYLDEKFDFDAINVSPEINP